MFKWECLATGPNVNKLIMWPKALGPDTHVINIFLLPIRIIVSTLACSNTNYNQMTIPNFVYVWNFICAFMARVKIWSDIKDCNHHPYSKSCFHILCIVRKKIFLLKYGPIYADNVTVLFLLPGTVTIDGVGHLTKCLWAHNYNLVKMIFAVIMILFNQADPICVHIITTELLWHMQNCDLISLLFLFFSNKSYMNIFSIMSF